MSVITLQNASEPEVTILSNQFIDEHMAKANGEFVKVYIYLLRLLADAPASLSLETMADRLLCTEKDICRALKYWQKEGLITLNFDGDKKLCGIVLGNTSETPAPQTEPSAKPADVPASPKKLTPDRVKELKQNEEIVQLLYIAEQYLGKTLSPSEVQKILFFYDELHMSEELIEYLIEYCVGRNHKSMRYMETVALSWAEEHITTVAMAKNANARYGKEYYTILKSMGITGRAPVETEVSLMDTWIKDYGFDMSLIQEACSRTVLATGQPSFQYTDRILSDWKKKNVKTMADVQLLDEEHKKRSQKKTASRTAAPKSSNRFNNFHQREYNFEEYEKQLLKQ